MNTFQLSMTTEVPNLKAHSVKKNEPPKIKQIFYYTL